MNAEDWRSTGALVISVAALGFAAWAAWHAKRSADAAERSADASERSVPAAERQATAAEAALPPPPRSVKWSTELMGNGFYALRNDGTDTVTGVWLDETRTPALRDEDSSYRQIRDRRVKRGHSLRFRIEHDDVTRPWPSEVWVGWDGQPEPIPVAVEDPSPERGLWRGR